MPRDYSKGKIYCIRSHQTDMVYVGSTINKLSQRMSHHRVHYRKYLKDNSSRYTSSFEIIKHEDAYIELIKLCPCKCRVELEREEGKYIREMNCVNKRIAGRTYKEYCQDNKEKIKKRRDKYYQKNKKKDINRINEWREKNKEKITAKTPCPHCNAVMQKRNITRHIKNSCKQVPQISP